MNVIVSAHRTINERQQNAVIMATNRGDVASTGIIILNTCFEGVKPQRVVATVNFDADNTICINSSRNTDSFDLPYKVIFTADIVDTNNLTSNRITTVAEVSSINDGARVVTDMNHAFRYAQTTATVYDITDDNVFVESIIVKLN